MKKFNNLLKTIFFSLLVFCSCFYFSNNFSHSEKFYTHAAEPVSTTSSAKIKLNSHAQNLYDYLATKIKSVANGTEDETSFTIPKSTLTSWGVKTKWTAADAGQPTITKEEAFSLFMEQFTVSKLLSALLHDLPFEMFWFNKTEGISQLASITTTSTYCDIETLIISFDVCEEYRPSTYDEENPTIDTVKVQAALPALENAKQIVSDYASLNDHQKLNAYKNKICELVEYNDSAIENPTPYGNPWQVIYVFDNNPLTNVVCEGYAKAFQLLCNLSTFTSPYLKCYTVSGTMTGGTGAGAHMWNVVTMDDQHTYLVDVTNSDSGTVGQSGTLFLSGTSSGTLSSGYTFTTPSQITFSYNAKTIALWSNSSESILNLNTRNYEANHPTISLTLGEIIYDNNKISAALSPTENVDITFSFNTAGWVNSDYNWSVEWFSDNNTHLGEKLEDAPTNANFYWIKIIATNKIDSTIKYIHSQRIEIKPKQIFITSVTGENRVYDGTMNITITNAVLEGVLGADNVIVDYPFVTAQISNANVGEYNKVNLSNIKLKGSHKNNYYVADISNVSSNTITISKAKPTCSAEYNEIKDGGIILGKLPISITAKGVLDETIEGTYIWTNSKGEEIDPNSIEIEKDVTYYYLFTPTDSNYESTIVEVKLWDTTNQKVPFFSKENAPLLFKISLLGAVVIVIAIAIIKLNKKSKEN